MNRLLPQFLMIDRKNFKNVVHIILTKDKKKTRITSVMIHMLSWSIFMR